MDRIPGIAPVLAVALLGATVACAGPADPAAGTPELRAALFDTIMARTARRTAFSQPKQHALGFEPLSAMWSLRDDVVVADSEEKLFYALARLSHARRDRHLDVALVPGGLSLPDSTGIDVWGGPAAPEPRQAPIRVFPDYGVDGPAYFVGDVADDEALAEGPEPGWAVLSVNGMAIAEYEATLREWTRHSSLTGLRWKIAEALTMQTAALPPELRAEALRLDVEAPDGTRRSVTLPYREAATLRWEGRSEPRYPGMQVVRSTPTYDLLYPDDGRPLVGLIWYGFRETLVADVDTLVAIAEREGWLDHALLVDVTRSRGGSLGAYAIQHMTPRAFKTTFGTVRVSDIIEPFVEAKRADFAARDINDGGVPEVVDDGEWLMAWLEEDLMAALARGDSVTAPVPFKLAHAPRDSDGVLPPSAVHFRGPLVVVSGPKGGSHLDQFNSIIVDNALGHVIGMTAGGYSNTWEWEEVLTFPGTDTPVVGFMWNIGHTVRPNGEVLEGNPAAVDEWVPLTAENTSVYYELLFERVLAHLSDLGHPAGQRR
jgi:hypothetical protein